MKRLKAALITLLLSSSIISASEAAAGDRRVNDILIGAGSGALIGQAVGRDTEATLIGSAVGGVVGYVIGNELDRHDTVIVHDRRPRQVIHHYPRPYYRDRAYYPRHEYRPNQKVCRETVRIKDRHHGRDKRVVTTTCWYENPRHDYRRYYDRNDHRRWR